MSTPDLPWIDPTGGLGDVLMMSGVLKHLVDRDPARRFHLVTRYKYGPFLGDHPAIASVGHPPPGCELISTAYWMRPEYAAGARAFQCLARCFGVEEDLPEELWLPPLPAPDPLLLERLPWREHNVLVAPASESPRKQAPYGMLEEVVAGLRAEGAFVVQGGRRTEPYLRGAYNLCGLTTPKEFLALLPRFDLVLTVDNFAMHGAHLMGVPAIVLWGTTRAEQYGYPGHTHLQARPECATPEGCVAPGNGDVYGQPCDAPEGFCMAQHEPTEVLEACRQVLDAGPGPSPGAGPRPAGVAAPPAPSA